MSELIIGILGGVFLVLFLGVFAAYIDWSTQIKSKVNHFDGLNQFDRNRLLNNLAILQLLTDYAMKNPSQRIGQILINTDVLQDRNIRDPKRMGWEPPFYYIDRIILNEEPGAILRRMEKALAKNTNNVNIKKETNN